MKRLEEIEAINKEQQLLIDKLNRDVLEKESEVTKMNPWKPKYHSSDYYSD